MVDKCRLRCVSEIVAALLLLLIVVLVGFLIYLAFLSQSVGFTRGVERVRQAAEESLVGVKIVEAMVYVTNTSGGLCGYLELLLSASYRPVKLVGVYVAGYPVYPDVSSMGYIYSGCGRSLPSGELVVLPGEANYTVLPLTTVVLDTVVNVNETEVKVIASTPSGRFVEDVYLAPVYKLS